MKCYEHPQQDAIGICARCRQGVCRESADYYKSIIMCKADIARIKGQQKILAPLVLGFIAFSIVISVMVVFISR